jgi:putative heme-binding domain-containing protein
MRWALFSFWILSSFSLRAVVSEDALPHQAEWISASNEGRTTDRAFFRRTFEINSQLVKAVLLATADQRAEIQINRVRAAEVTGFQQAITVDVTSLIRTGTNALTVRAANDTGLAAFRMMLELVFADGKQRWVVSDKSWVVSRRETAGWMEPGFRADDWAAPFTHGAAGLEKWGNPFQATKSPDAYNSWMLARDVNQATDPQTISALTGFKVELLRSAQPGEDSWVALAFDPRGRLTVAREKRGLLRMTVGSNAVQQVEVIQDTLLECRGLLYAYDSLYVNANNSKGFYRLRDTDGDDQFDDQKLLLATEGGVGHGRNHLALGPDGYLYLAHGDDIVLPTNLATNSSLRQMPDDQLIPTRAPQAGRTTRRFAQVGHVLQTDREGSFFRLVAGGLRNPIDIAFNAAGEMFTYDADMERDIATPWYQPTRVLHLVPGGDYGWRRSLPNLPAYAPDTLPGTVDIGVGSPTGVAFGTASHFPEKYRRAFFIADWAYGRILAVHLRADGASYRGTAETFLSGRPLNVTDFTFGPEGAMYFITGGRGTKSGLYRTTYHPGPGEPKSLVSDRTAERAGANARALRRRLENLGSNSDPSGISATNALAEIWPALGNSDRWIRYAARTALEHQPLDQWRERALNEINPRIAFAALLATGRVTDSSMQERLLSRLGEFLRPGLPPADQLEVLRVIALQLARFGRPSDQLAAKLTQQLDELFPSSQRSANHELCRLLAFLRSPNVVAKTCDLLAHTRRGEDLLHYAYCVAAVPHGWTMEHRRVFFDALRRAEQEQGGSDYYRAIKTARQEARGQLTSEQATQLADVLAPAHAIPDTVGGLAASRPFVRDWKLEDFDFSSGTRRGVADAGAQAYRDAGCAQCHRFGNEGSAFGPDLTSVASRFNRRDLLETILNPSQAIDDKFRTTILTLRNGDELSGILDREEDEIFVLDGGPTGDTPIEVQKAELAARRLSEVSPMPAGLLNSLTEKEIVDLLAFLERGNPNAERGTRIAEP